MRRRGMSLAEVVLAIAIMAVVLVVAGVILQAVQTSLRTQEHTTRAAFLAQQKLEEFRALPSRQQSSGQGVFPTPFQDYSWNVAVSAPSPDAKGLAPVQVQVQGPASAQYTLSGLAWHPRQLWLASNERGTAGQLVRVNEDGAGWKAMTSGAGHDSEPTLSPDGKTVVFQSDGGGGRQLVSMPADGSAPPRPLLGAPGGASEPSFSPDGLQLAFTVTQNGYAQVMVLNLASGQAVDRSPSDRHEGSPSWSPDGQTLLFVSTGDAGCQIGTMSATGSGRQVLTETEGWNASPCFTANGKSVLFMSNRAGNPEIYSIDAHGSGSPTRLTDNPAYDTEPRVSSDGQKVVFQSDRDGAPRLYLMNLDGSQVRPLVALHRPLSPATYERDGVWAP